MLITFDILPRYKRSGRRRSRRLIWQSFWRNANTQSCTSKPRCSALPSTNYIQSSPFICWLAATMLFLFQEEMGGKGKRKTRLSCIMNECRQKEPTSCCCHYCCCFAAIPLTAPPKSSTKAKHIYSAVPQEQQQQQQQAWNGVEKS